ncbi:alpha/beta hydrolase [Noviherbaspirillum sedimenti]|uniref:Alpha/beta hydrolase n=1 Tax=Noviherbaspirillum sedimenti TaxID=2320865 RepID=A0A3A3G450_9BURK|nr:alpha/beta hydrolase [Noviherbaspirillum sedimenti]RJG02711.1 alpha/beta hydrolase [Noviherbaspirillum sedimenti]
MDRLHQRAASQAAIHSYAGWWRCCLPLLLVILLAWQSASAGVLPAGVTVRRNIAYGSDPQQRFDLYLPPQAQDAPVLFMVHGGGWRRGDKAMAAAVDNKVAHWVPQGVILISANYRMLSDAPPLEQARDVARALATAQAQAASWGGARGKFVLMGHSAGAHLVALLASTPSLLRNAGAAPVLGTIALDSAAYDIEKIMRARHPRLYDQAFGADPQEWAAASPYRQLDGAIQPMLAVCSARRKDACPQARHFAAKAESLGGRAQVLALDMSHRDINLLLGRKADYTRQVDEFLRMLDPQLASMLLP